MVRFRGFRDYEEHKSAANNAMMALLAGAQLSAHLLRLTEGSERLLPELFPAVEHINRFNLKPDLARQILLSADAHLGKMAVPYVLALHEDYMRTCLGLLRANQLCTAGQLKGNLVDLHPTFAALTGHQFDSDMMRYLTALRLMRNAVIHNGSTVTQALRDELNTWTTAQVSGWTALAKRNPVALQVGDAIELGHGELIAALAVTKRLDREVNLGLQAKLPRQCWAKMVVDEVYADHPHITSSQKVLLRKASGIARHHYAALGLTSAELQVELSSR